MMTKCNFTLFYNGQAVTKFFCSLTPTKIFNNQLIYLLSWSLFGVIIVRCGPCLVLPFYSVDAVCSGRCLVWLLFGVAVVGCTVAWFGRCMVLQFFDVAVVSCDRCFVWPLFSVAVVCSDHFSVLPLFGMAVLWCGHCFW